MQGAAGAARAEERGEQRGEQRSASSQHQGQRHSAFRRTFSTMDSSPDAAEAPDATAASGAVLPKKLKATFQTVEAVVCEHI